MMYGKCDGCGEQARLERSFATSKDLCGRCYEQECPECRHIGEPSSGSVCVIQSRFCRGCGREIRFNAAK